MKITYNSPVVLTYGLICTAVLLLDKVFEGLIGNYFTVGGTFHFNSVTDYLRLFTHIIGHASWDHLISNFAFILLIGPILEEKHGSKNLLFMILITAFVTAVLNILFFNTGLLGASGIVFMMILLGSMVNFRKGEIPLTFIFILLLYIGREVYAAFSAEDNISQFAHIIGGLCGGAFGFMTVRTGKTS